MAQITTTAKKYGKPALMIIGAIVVIGAVLGWLKNRQAGA